MKGQLRPLALVRFFGLSPVGIRPLISPTCSLFVGLPAVVSLQPDSTAFLSGVQTVFYVAIAAVAAFAALSFIRKFLG